MLPQGLPHRARIHLRRDFENIISQSEKYQNSGLTLWCRKTQSTGPARLAVVVSKKLGPAVVRNRTKRLIREAFRTNRVHLKTGADLIVKPRSSERLATVQATQQAFMSLCKKADLLQELPN